MRPRGRLHGHLRRGLAASLLVHLNVLGPLIVATFLLAAREEAQKPDEVDVAFENVTPEELPADLPALDDTPPPDKKAPEPLKPKKDLKAPEKVAEVKPPPPEPEVVVPPEPERAAEPPPPPPPIEKKREKVVNLDNDKEVEPPPDAKYLAQKNNRAEQETRATNTNLEREEQGEEASRTDESKADAPEPGDAKTKVAELEEQKSLAGRKAPETTPRLSPQSPTLEDERQTPPRPALALRDRPPQPHEITPETVDPSLPKTRDGMIGRPSPQKPKGADAPSGAERERDMKLALTGKDYEYLFGAEAKAERALAQKQRSTREGRHSERMARVRAALENFIPEVKPGNQTALNTRADPFAAFIDRMHRNIHKLWGYGALEDWDELPASSPFNDETLMTKLEIVMNADGTVHKVTVVRPSRYLAFDVAAIDAVFSAGPFPEPPRQIRSGNGKIYVHWNFHRDAHQCATTGASPFILDNAPAGGEREPEPGHLGHSHPPGASRGVAAAGAGTQTGEPVTGDGTRADGPRRLERFPESGPRLAHAAGAATEDGSTMPRSDDEAAMRLVRDWFAAFSRGDVGAMTARAAFPFRASGVTVGNQSELGRMLEGVLAESSQRTVRALSVETAAGLRRRLGKLPPGLDDGSGLLFGLGQLEADTLVMILAQTKQGWKVTGLIRR